MPIREIPAFQTQELGWLLLGHLLNFSVSANVLFCFLPTSKGRIFKGVELSQGGFVINGQTS